MSILGNDLLLAGTDEGYNLTRSLRFRSSASAYLSRTPASAGNQKTWTWSAWLKRGSLSGNQTLFQAFVTGGSYFWFLFGGDNKIYIAQNPSATIDLSTTQEFRDPSAWYHIVLAFDTTQATAANRVKLYVNGSQVTSFINTGYPTQNFDTFVNTTVHHNIGTSEGTGPSFTQNFDGYLTEVNFIDGQALTPSSFGETDTITGVWKPKRFAGTYGTNGFYLPFTDNSALTTSSNAGLGKDFSGNGNYWTTNNISITAGVTYDSMTDVPTLTSATAANFCVANPLNQVGATINSGNLRIEFTASTSGCTATFGMPSGKWYWETTITQIGTSCGIGIVNDAGAGQLGSGSGYGQGAGSWAYREDGQKRNNSSGSSYGASYTTGDVIGVAFDADSGSITFYKNGTSQGVAFSGIATATYYPVFGASIAVNNIQNVNFGQRPFTYTPPTGYVALNTYNLPTGTILKGNTVMDATTYTGNGSTQTITNAASFRPDLVWYKARSFAYNNSLFDSVRGATKQLISNTIDAEATLSGVTAFNSNGFSLGNSVNGNNNGTTYVGWQWQAGQGTTSSNTNGTITSTVSVNASAGFSVVTYTGNGTNPGATIGHGLGVTPAMIITKSRSTTGEWPSYHQSLPISNTLYLNATYASSTYQNRFSAVSSSTFTTGSSGSELNTNGTTYVAYCWTPIAGYSAFGSYTGNGSSDGTFVYTGFRPKFIMIKRSDSAGNNWRIWDTARAPYNAGLPVLYPNTSDAEDLITDTYDLLSNGFKLRTSGVGTNASGGTYIYAAFAENPFKNSLAR